MLIAAMAGKFNRSASASYVLLSEAEKTKLVAPAKQFQSKSEEGGRIFKRMKSLVSIDYSAII